MCVRHLDDTSNGMSKRSSNDKHSLYKGRAMASLINEKKFPIKPFYEQTNICVPLVLSANDFGKITIAIELILFLCCYQFDSGLENIDLF